MTNQWTCRDALTALAGLGSTLALAGCTNAKASQKTLSENSVFEDISFGETRMIVRLRDDHDVNRLNLISPDGTRFATKNVPVGATTVRIRILEISEFNPKHYQPGTNRLLAIAGGEIIEAVELEMQPEIRVDDVAYGEEEKGDLPGAVRVTLSNVGTSPTWVYDIVFEDAPNRFANTKLSEPGLPQLGDIFDQTRVIIESDESKTFVAPRSPLRFTGNRTAQQACEKEVRFEMRIGVASGQVLTNQLTASTGGKVDRLGASSQYACTETTVRREAE